MKRKNERSQNNSTEIETGEGGMRVTEERQGGQRHAERQTEDRMEEKERYGPRKSTAK